MALKGSFSAAPLANVILTTFFYVSPVPTMPAWDQTGVPGDVGLTHFHSSTISGSSACTISRTFASVFPCQSPSSLIFSSINADENSTGIAFACTVNSRSAQRNLQPPQAKASSAWIAVRKDDGNSRAGLRAISENQSSSGTEREIKETKTQSPKFRPLASRGMP
jgi:hypothetical protein